MSRQGFEHEVFLCTALDQQAPQQMHGTQGTLQARPRSSECQPGPRVIFSTPEPLKAARVISCG